MYYLIDLKGPEIESFDIEREITEAVNMMYQAYCDEGIRDNFKKDIHIIKGKELHIKFIE